MYWNAIYWDDYFIINSAGANIANMTNSYDLASRITAEQLNGTAPTSYQYDVTDQLTNDAVKPYSYDLNGNRTMAGYTTGPGNEVTSDGIWNFFCDMNGNLTGNQRGLARDWHVYYCQ